MTNGFVQTVTFKSILTRKAEIRSECISACTDRNAIESECVWFRSRVLRSFFTSFDLSASPTALRCHHPFTRDTTFLHRQDIVGEANVLQKVKFLCEVVHVLYIFLSCPEFGLILFTITVVRPCCQQATCGEYSVLVALDIDTSYGWKALEASDFVAEFRKFFHND